MAKQNLPVDLSDLGLSHKELTFVGEYCTNGFNEFEALKSAGIVPKTHTPAQARMVGMLLVNKPEVKKAVQRFTSSVLDPYRDKLEYKTLQVLNARAYYDVSTFYNADGSVKDLEQIPQEARYAIDDVTEDFKGKDADVRTVKYKLADRMQAQKAINDLLKKTEADGGDVKIPQDRQSWLSDIFSKAVEAGASAAIKGQNSAKERTVVPSAPPKFSNPKIAQAFAGKVKDNGSEEV